MARLSTRMFARAGFAAMVIAAPMALAAPAQAASEATWERVAECESDQRWHLDTGNGYYGGLQFSDQTWDSFGGEKYAATADEASKEQQIAIAEKVQDAQGWDAWPTCSDKAGVA